jgi:hypothetical protein
MGGFHSSQDEDAGTLLKALGLERKQELRTIGTPKASRQRSAFSGVSYHSGNNKFIVQGMSTGSTYTTSREAAVARARMLKLEKPPQKRVSAQELLERVSLLREVYTPVTGKAWLPADLQSMFEHARKAHMMFTAKPALEVLRIQSKYVPWRHALLASWKQQRSALTPTGDIEVSSVDDLDLHARASRLPCALTQTINCVAQTKVPM